MTGKKSDGTELAEQAAAFAEFAAQILVAARQAGVDKTTVDPFPLDEDEQAVVAGLPGLSATAKRKLAKSGARFSVADTAGVLSALAEALCDGEPLLRLRLLFLGKKLLDGLQDGLVATASAKVGVPTDVAYRFRIALIDAEPEIWRRIEVRDCSLAAFHGHVQTAMGWTNSHLHQFDIDGRRYGDPGLLGDEFENEGGGDSTRALLSEVLPAGDGPFAFLYEYDFGDGWEHEIVFEGRFAVDPRAAYPRCTAGERACPPEDCGGVWGYADLLEVLADRKHPEHAEMREWIGRRLDPGKFDRAAATKAMRRGLPDWRAD